MLWLPGVLAVLAATIVNARIQLPPPPGPQEIPNTYLITFAKNATQNKQDDHVRWLRELEANNEEVAVRHVFSLAFTGYSAVLNQDTLEKVRHMNEVESIEYVGLSTLQRENVVSILENSPLTVNRHMNQEPNLKAGIMVQPNRGWNANRISHRNFTKGYSAGPWQTNRNLGRGVTVYVLDTGINLKNPGFTGTQMVFGKNLVGTRSRLRVSDNDVHGHGTMCAGVIAGNRHGLSPDARVVAVKIANDQNRSATDDVVAGIEWVLSQPGDNNLKVISMSHYGFTGVPDVSTAVGKAVDRGLHFVVCAGNDGRDACRVQPSNARGVISVGSINGFNKLPVKGTQDAGGKEMESTNIGRCITIFAPGTRVPTLSAKNIDPNYRYFSWGTSVAAPQVAAFIANRLSEVGKQSPAQIRAWLQSTATTGQIEGDLKGSPNLILYNGLGG
jgi:subtilisin family serine protease